MKVGKEDPVTSADAGLDFLRAKFKFCCFTNPEHWNGKKTMSITEERHSCSWCSPLSGVGPPVGIRNLRFHKISLHEP